MSAFIDTNILVYANSADPKQSQALAILAQGGIISVQVLNEFVNVLRKRMRRLWNEVYEALRDARSILEPPRPITDATHLRALDLSEDHQLSLYDSLILASALEAGCDTLWTEDLQHGRRFAGLTIKNPFCPDRTAGKQRKRHAHRRSIPHPRHRPQIRRRSIAPPCRRLG